ncbi:excinuclease ABC subunit C [bacterium CG2_30_54_10]|nr:MAG: excinuclease ABC subunit C [bacterium CG2_30_54_10]
MGTTCLDSARLKRLLANIPALPGVYLMRDTGSTIIYIGKSRTLKNRVKSYFSGKHRDRKTEFLVAAIADIEFIVTDTEIEALILENNLIKRHRPRYNIQLKDSKTHPYLRVTLKDRFPRIEKVRHVSFKDGNAYFGPFPDEGGLNRIIDLLSRTLRLCVGGRVLKPGKPANKACLRFHLGQCQGACIGAVSAEEYRKAADKAVEILSGREYPDLNSMREKMGRLSEEFRFEEAAEMRDTVGALESFFLSQKVEVFKQVDRDLWGIAESPDRLVASVFFVRGGKLLGNRTIDAEKEPGASVRTLMGSLMQRFYERNLIPPRILLTQPPVPLLPLEEFLGRICGHPVKFGTASRGPFRRLLKMAGENATEVLKNLKSTGSDRVSDGVLDLERRLSLPRLPMRIECIDISHIQGVDTVASLVVAVNGEPRRSEYRLFHIKGVVGIDDPASIAEVSRRRFSRVLREGGPLADLLVVDGGIAQARAARAELDLLKLDRLVYGLAKREELMVPPVGEPIRLPIVSPGMRVLIRLRNEAHRFANTFQNKTHSRKVMRSALLNLPGVGMRTLQKLIETFGSIEKAARATAQELSTKAGIPAKVGELIHASLFPQGFEAPPEKNGAGESKIHVGSGRRL